MPDDGNWDEWWEEMEGAGKPAAQVEAELPASDGGNDEPEDTAPQIEAQAVLPNGGNYLPESVDERQRIWMVRIIRHGQEILRADPEYHKGHLTFEDVLRPLKRELWERIQSTAHNSAYAVFQPPAHFHNGDLERALDICCEAAWKNFKEKDRNNLLLDGLGGLPEPPKPAKRGTLTMSVDPEPIEWLWPNHIEIGTISDIQGDPGTGKSAITASIAAIVSTGGQWPTGEKCEVGGVIVINGEEDLKKGIVPHLIAAGADRRRIKAYTLHEEPLFELPRDLDVLEEDVKELKARAVIIDPLDCFVSEDVEMNRNQIVRRMVLAALARLASGYGFAVIQVRHLNKDAKTKVAMYRGGGSIALNAASRAVWMAGPSPAEPGVRVMAPVKVSNAPAQRSLKYQLEGVSFTNKKNQVIETIRVKWLGECDIKASELLKDELSEKGEKKEKAAKSKLEVACDVLRAILADGLEHDSSDIEADMKSQGVAYGMMFKAKEAIGARARPKGYQGGWVWWLPAVESEEKTPDRTDDRPI